MREARPSETRLWLIGASRAFQTGTALNMSRCLAVGRAAGWTPVPSLILGLRAGTCHVLGTIPELGAEVLVGRFQGDGLGWYASVPEEFLPMDDAVWRAGDWHGPLPFRWGSRKVSLGRCYLDDGETEIIDGRPGGWVLGHAGDLCIGDDLRKDWRVATSAPGRADCHVDFDGHRLELRGSLRRSGVGLELHTAEPIGASHAYAIVQEVLPILRLATEFGLDVVAIWSADKATGCTAFDERTRSIRHRLIPDVHVPTFVAAATKVIEQSTEDERKVLRVIIDMLMVACEPDLETSIAMASSALELASEEWLPKAKGEHGVEAEARAAIREDFILSASSHAPGTEYERNAPEAANHLFKRTAKERFRALLEYLALPESDDGVAQFVNMRNKVVHGGFQKKPLNERLEALYFGRWMLANCIVRYLGYDGPTVDWREHVIR